MSSSTRSGDQRRNVLTAKKVTRVYRQGATRLEVLKGITLSIAAGDFLVIVGPSGAGKSTLLHILGLLDTPTSGEVWFDGKNLTRLSQRMQARLRNRLFGFVFQFFHLLPDFTALENVMLPAMVGVGVLRWPRVRNDVRSRAEDLLARLGLGDRMRHKPGQLSGGERQRVAIARALMNRPRILLLDEPTGNLDTKTGKEILTLVHELNEIDGQTVAMVTHDAAAADRATRIVTMRDGEIVGSKVGRR